MNDDAQIYQRTYPIKRTWQSEFIPIRHHTYHVQVWNKPDAGHATRPPLVLMHGWMDVAASYQFMVDALSDAFVQNRLIIAADWRGYGLTTGDPTDNYWYPDYMADLDHLLDHYAPDQPVDLVGHSMGGNVVMLYAGVRPQRIAHLVNLEGFGMPATQPSQAPGRYAKWMDEIKSLHRGDLALKTYASVQAVAERLMKTNPRLARDAAGQARAHWLAQHWAKPNAQGQWEILGDAAHKITNAQLYRVEEVLELYQRITAPVLAVEASDDSLGQWWADKYTKAEYHQRLKSVPNCQIGGIEDAGHMLHHDQPQQLATMLEDFVQGK